MKREPVASEREQDKWLHRLLRQQPAARPTAAAGACLEAETVAAWADGALSAKELAAAEVHVASCPRCLALLAAVERTAPGATPELHARRLWLRWLVPVTAAATAVVIWIAIPQQQVTPVARQSASVPAPVAPPYPVPPAEAPQPQAAPKQASGARVDDLSSQNRLAREERAIADSAGVAESAPARENEAAGQSAFATPASPSAPVPPASADASNENLGAVAQKKELNQESITEAVSPNDPFIRWRVLSGTDVERSTDGGKTWTRVSSPPGPISDIRGADALNATVTTTDGRTLSTADGGATWVPAQEKPAAPF